MRNWGDDPIEPTMSELCAGNTSPDDEPARGGKEDRVGVHRIEHHGHQFEAEVAEYGAGGAWYCVYERSSQSDWYFLANYVPDLLEAVRARVKEHEMGVVLCTACHRRAAMTTSFYGVHPPICDKCANAESQKWWIGGYR